MTTTTRLTWHRDAYTGSWSTSAPEFHAQARRIAGAWWLTVWQFGQRANGSGQAAKFRTLAEAKAEAQTWADTTAEVLP